MGQQAGAVPGHEGDGAEEGKNDEGEEGRPGFGPAHGDAEKALQSAVISRLLERFVGEGFYVGDALHGFFDDGAGFREGVLGGLGISPYLFAEEGDREHHKRHAAQHDQRKLPRGKKDEAQSSDEDHGLPHRLGDGAEEGLADEAEIGGDAVAEGPGALLLEEGHRQAHQMAEKVAPQPVQGRFPSIGEALDPPEGDEGLEGEDAGEFEHHAV